MALTIFLSKVSNLEIIKTKTKLDLYADEEDTLTQTINEEHLFLFCAKVSFRGINLWSNNVPIQDGIANFIARGNKAKKFHFNLATDLVPDDKLRIEFYTVTMKKNRKKLMAIFELILESLIDLKHIDLQEENLSDPNNYLIKATVQLKLYYTPPDIDREKAALGIVGDEAEIVDWSTTFDEGGRHGGHRSHHVQSKHDSKFTKLRRKLVGRADDADTDSYSDSDFDETKSKDGQLAPMSTEEKSREKKDNLELLEKSLGRYEGDVYQKSEWQILVHVLQGRDFVGLDINPYVCVQIDNKKRFTGVHKSTNSPFFGEYFTFDFDLPATQMMEKVIYFKVHTDEKIVSTFTHTKPIGIFKVDVTTIYNEKDHLFERKWAQLINPDSVQVTCGHLFLSIAVTERGVSAKNILGEMSPGDDELKPSRMFVPAAMLRDIFPVQLKITLFGAMELPEMMTDFLATVSKKVFRSNDWQPVDPFAEVTYNAIQVRTDHLNGTSPAWGEAFYLIGQFPPLVRTIKVAIKDHAAVQQDRVMASFLIDLLTISETNRAVRFLPTFGPTWVFLYGSSREYTINKSQDGLGEGLGEAVCYKGRLLMQIDCHPISGDHTSNKNIQKESGLQFPDPSKFPLKRTFLLFGCIFDVTMIDKEFGNTTICFELSIGSSGYSKPNQLINHEATSSVTRPYPRIPVGNNTQHFRLPIDLQKPVLFTKHDFHDYTYRMAVSNRLKQAAKHMSKLIQDFKSNLNSKASSEVLMKLYRKMEQYIHTLPCGCGEQKCDEDNLTMTGTVHPTLSEYLNAPGANARMNTLDEYRRKRISHNLESLKGWISADVKFEDDKQLETVKQLEKIARALKQLASDAQPALPDVFLWMICDSKRVAYARISPEDLLYSVCQGDRGLFNGRVQTLFLRTPRTSDKPIKSSTNAKIQIYLWLGTEEQQGNIFKQLPPGFDMPTLPLSVDCTYIRYNGRFFYELRCHCYKARSLIASDETGLSDPYLSITAGNETQTTPILKGSLCPQWDVTLVFQHLMHVGSRETAEEIVGNVVVECYDYDEGGDGSDLIGRFPTTAKLDLFVENKCYKRSAFQWYEFKFGEKRAGELLAVFELIEVNPETREAESKYDLEEIPATPANYPPDFFIIQLMKNKIYYIPELIVPPSKIYEIEVMFWGLRECRRINLQPIQQAKVTIECAGERVDKTIKDIQKNPNFEYSETEADTYKLAISLPEDKNFWPHISIYCVTSRYFGKEEVVGNLVVTNLEKYLEKPPNPLTATDVAVANAVNEFSKTVPHDFNRVRRSVIDAYEAVVSGKDQEFAKKKFTLFEKAAGQKSINESEVELATDDTLAEEKLNETINDEVTKNLTDMNVITEEALNEIRPLTDAEKTKRNEMEKTATWWSKYYASKAKLKLRDKPLVDTEILENSREVYADFFEEPTKTVVKQHQVFWNKTKNIFIRAGKAHKELTTKARERMERIGDKLEDKSAVDASLDIIENDRLRELTFLQTFDIIETELENVRDYEEFNDCLDKFPLYKGKGTSRSDELGDESRVYAKFKGKFRIHEVIVENTHGGTVGNISRSSRPSTNPGTLQSVAAGVRTNEQMLKFDFNRNPVTFKCRLYIIKALLFRARDRSGKADPFIKVLLNNDVIINDVQSKHHNTLEPVFGKSYEFEVTIPKYSLLRIQVWDWDLANTNDKIGETSIDIENRWLSCHRATCALPKRYDSVGYNGWRDTKRPTVILEDLCRSANLNSPVYLEDSSALAIGDIRFNCDPECVEFVRNTSSNRLIHRKVHHESPEDYIKQNTALAALHGWGRKINPKGALVAEHIECRSLFDPEYPGVEQGKVEMWLDFFPMSRPPTSAPVDITPPKPKSYQLRLIIWNTSDVELDDENPLTGEKSSDIYVKGWILGENEDKQETDVHYRSLSGEGNFNFRFIFDFNYLEIEEKIVFEKSDSIFQIGNIVKKIPPKIVLRVYDADLISADDFLGQCVLDLTHLPVGAKAPKKCKAEMLTNPKHPAVNLFNTKRATGWWPLIAPRKPGEMHDPSLLGGKLEAEFSLVTEDDAKKTPVGKGQDPPQPLPKPNRPVTSFFWFTSPWKTFQYVIWKNFKGPIFLGLFIFICIIFLLLALWSLPVQIVQQVFNKIFKTNGGRK